jgi:hypothetical protein
MSSLSKVVDPDPNASEICVYRDVQISSLLVETFMKWCSISNLDNHSED